MLPLPSPLPRSKRETEGCYLFPAPSLARNASRRGATSSQPPPSLETRVGGVLPPPSPLPRSKRELEGCYLLPAPSIARNARRRGSFTYFSTHIRARDASQTRLGYLFLFYIFFCYKGPRCVTDASRVSFLFLFIYLGTTKARDVSLTRLRYLFYFYLFTLVPQRPETRQRRVSGNFFIFIYLPWYQKVPRHVTDVSWVLFLI